MKHLAKFKLSNLVLLVGVCLGFCIAEVATGQTKLPEVIDVTIDPYAEMDEATLKKEFDAAIEELRDCVKEAKHAEMTHFHVDSETAIEYREKWEEAADRGKKVRDKTIAIALTLFQKTKNPSQDLSRIVLGTYARLYREGKLELCSRLTQKLSEQFPEDKEENEGVTIDLARGGAMTNDFERAVKFMKKRIKIVQKLPRLEQGVFYDSKDLMANWIEELEIREAEAKADDLPRVELETSKGKIVIELFENEAPETVANFVSLVEAGFYDDIIFHRSIKNYVAHAGRMTFNRLQPTGYTIYDEHKKPNARHHFRGSLSMVVNPEVPNSGTSEFYIVRSPFSVLDQYHTVFGRVISDMQVVDALQETWTLNEEGVEEGIKEVTPDMILSAKVIRKRDHAYEPNRVKEDDKK